MNNYTFCSIPKDESLILFTNKDTKISFLCDLTLYGKNAKEEKNLLYKGNYIKDNNYIECDVIGYKIKEGYNRYTYYKSNDIDYKDDSVDKDSYDKIIKNYSIIEENDKLIIYDKSNSKNEESYKYITLIIKLIDKDVYMYINPQYLKQMQSKKFGKEIEKEEEM